MKKLAVIGSINLDYVVNVDHIPVVGETVLARFAGQYQGGKGANQAVAVAKLGGDVTLLGAVGQDAAGELLLEGLASSGVRVDHVLQAAEEVSGQAWIAVNRQGNNAITVIPGANSRADIPYLQSVQKVIEEADIVLLQLEIPIEAVVYAAQFARELGKYVVLDPAPAMANLPETLLANVDLIKPNEVELEILTGYGPGEHHRGARLLQEKGVGNVLVTLGEQGVYLLLEQGEGFHSPAHRVQVVDTTAAGDSFLAAVAVCLAEGKSLEQAVDFGQKVAAVVVTRPGAQDSIPTRAELDDL